MRRLMLLRHAKSDWPVGVDDHLRPLAKRGRRDAPRIGEAMLARGLLPDLAIVSTATRTRQTWELVKAALGPVPERFEPTIYEASPDAILAAIRAAPAEVRSLLVVGHNPGLELTAGLLAEESLARQALAEKFPTAALAVIDLDVETWRTVGGTKGRLGLFLTPAGLD